MNAHNEIELFVASQGEVARTDWPHQEWLLHNFSVIKNLFVAMQEQIRAIVDAGGNAPINDLLHRVDVLEDTVADLQRQINNIHTGNDTSGLPGPQGNPGPQGPIGPPGASDNCLSIFHVGPYSPLSITDDMTCGIVFTN